jgi:hypothetical protein
MTVDDLSVGDSVAIALSSLEDPDWLDLPEVMGLDTVLVGRVVSLKNGYARCHFRTPEPYSLLTVSILVEVEDDTLFLRGQ